MSKCPERKERESVKKKMKKGSMGNKVSKIINQTHFLQRSNTSHLITITNTGHKYWIAWHCNKMKGNITLLKRYE